MTVAFIGTIVDMNLREVQVRDLETKEVLSCELISEDALIDTPIEIGRTAVFTGKYYAGKITIRRFVYKKFLEPLYEDDLLGLAGEFALLKAIDDPFTELYQKFLEEEKQRELLEGESVVPTETA